MWIAPEVIEHLENPRAVAREWYVKPGGTLMFSTANNESVRSLVSLLIRGRYAAFDDGSYPAYITALLCRDPVRVLDEAGFKGVRFEFTDSGGLPKMPVEMAAGYFRAAQGLQVQR
jgi:2-polyprenyl-3-methyl-5-hydroxy-6-metoxy-1,4-benzoquinol methylase